MHIIIGLITAIGGVVWALYRLQNSGVDLNAFNPFHWARRRQWEKKLGTKVIHQLENPMEAAGLLMVAIAKMEGEISREQKAEIIGLFESEFHLSNTRAVELFSSVSYILQEAVNIVAEVKNILAPCKAAFKSEQVESLVDMLNKIALLEGSVSEEQGLLIAAVKKELGIYGAP